MICFFHYSLQDSVIVEKVMTGEGVHNVKMATGIEEMECALVRVSTLLHSILEGLSTIFITKGYIYIIKY